MKFVFSIMKMFSPRRRPEELPVDRVYRLHDNLLPENESTLRLVFYKVEAIFRDRHFYLNPDADLSKVAREVGTNQSYVTRAIQKFTDFKGFSEYLNYSRIEFAKKILLAEPNASVNGIATKSGYSTTTAFTNNFKKLEDVSPGKWRKIHSADSTILK